MPATKTNKSDALRRYEAKAEKLRHLIERLEIHWEYLPRNDTLIAHGYENTNTVIEEIMAEFGFSKPVR